MTDAFSHMKFWICFRTFETKVKSNIQLHLSKSSSRPFTYCYGIEMSTVTRKKVVLNMHITHVYAMIEMHKIKAIVCIQTTVQNGSTRGGSRGVRWVRTNPPPKKDAPGNQRYEMIVDNKLKVFRKVYEQRRARCYEKSGFIFRALDAS